MNKIISFVNLAPRATEGPLTRCFDSHNGGPRIRMITLHVDIIFFVFEVQ